MNRTSLELYRDIFRLIKHVAGNSPKGEALRSSVRVEFTKAKDLVVSCLIFSIDASFPLSRITFLSHNVWI